MSDHELFGFGEVLVVLLAVWGLGVLAWGLRRIQPLTLALFHPMRHVPIAEAMPGNRVLHGTAEPIEDLVRAPLVDELVLAYELRVTEWTMGQDATLRESTTQVFRHGTLLAMRDDAGAHRIDVDLRRRTFDLARTNGREWTFGMFGELPVRSQAAKIIAKLGRPGAPRHTIALHTITAGNRYTIDGTVIRTFDEPGTLRVAGGREGLTHIAVGDPETLLSDTEAERFATRVVGMLFGVPLLAAAGVLQWFLLDLL